MMGTQRLQQLREQMERQGVGCLAFNAGPSLTYLTGLNFHLMERPVVLVILSDSDPVIILPQLEESKLAGLKFQTAIHTYGEDSNSWQDVFNNALANVAGESSSNGIIGIEPRQLRFLEYQLLRNALPEKEFIDGSKIVATLRMKKSAQEITCMQKAVEIAEQALLATLSVAKIGVREKQIASELTMQLIRHGSQLPLPFSPIVATGPNGANPHAKPTTRKLQSGDLLIIDWGASSGGYASDITRTFGVGKVDEKTRKIHDIVHQANQAGIQAGGEGIRCSHVDSVTRNVIEQAGYGEYFTHRTGHGIGMECHEEPYIVEGNDTTLQLGNTYTVEPGIYLQGQNGVRIEDDVLITADGVKSLSSLDRELRYVEEFT